MKIDVSGLRREVGGEATYVFSQQIDPLDQFGETITFEPVDATVKLYNAGESITAFFHVDTRARVRCSRCLEPHDEPISMDFQVVYQEAGKPGQDEQGERDDVVNYEGDLIDVSEDVRQQVILALPMKPVCAEDCKGLCPGCGQNLNLGKCNCPQEEGDARWTVLGDLFKKD